MSALAFTSTLIELKEAVANGKPKIHGILIHPGVTIHKNEAIRVHKYFAEDMIKAAPTLGGRPLCEDHEVMLGCTFDWGKWNAEQNGVEFEATITEEVVKRIKSGKYHGISACMNWMIEGGGLRWVNGVAPYNFVFYEGSLITHKMTPGDPQAYFELMEAVELWRGKNGMEIITEKEITTPQKTKIKNSRMGDVLKILNAMGVPEEQKAVAVEPLINLWETLDTSGWSEEGKKSIFDMISQPALKKLKPWTQEDQESCERVSLFLYHSIMPDTPYAESIARLLKIFQNTQELDGAQADKDLVIRVAFRATPREALVILNDVMNEKDKQLELLKTVESAIPNEMTIRVLDQSERDFIKKIQETVADAKFSNRYVDFSDFTVQGERANFGVFRERIRNAIPENWRSRSWHNQTLTFVEAITKAVA